MSSLGFQPTDTPSPPQQPETAPPPEPPAAAQPPSSPAADAVLMEVPLALIDTDAGTQGRAMGNSRDWVEELVGFIKDGQLPEMPPVELFRSDDPEDPDRYYIGDGFHRIAAAKEVEGIESIHARVRPGGFRAAWLHSRSANVTHGLKRNDKDRIAIIESILRDPILGKLSSRDLQPYCRVSHTTIQKHRRRLFPKKEADPLSILMAIPAGEEVDEHGWPTGLSWDQQRTMVERIGDIALLQKIRNSKDVRHHLVDSQIGRLKALQAAKSTATVAKLWKDCDDWDYPENCRYPARERQLLARLAAVANVGLPEDMTDAAGQFRASVVGACQDEKRVLSWLGIDGISRQDRTLVLRQYAWLRRISTAKEYNLASMSKKKMPPGIRKVYEARKKHFKEKNKARDERTKWLTTAGKSTPEVARKLLKTAADDKSLVRAWWRAEESHYSYSDPLAKQRAARAPIRAMLRSHLEGMGVALESCPSCSDTTMVVGKNCPRCQTTRLDREEKMAARANEWKETLSEEVRLAAAHLPADQLHAALAVQLKDALGVDVRIGDDSDFEPEAPAQPPEAPSSPPEDGPVPVWSGSWESTGESGTFLPGNEYSRIQAALTKLGIPEGMNFTRDGAADRLEQYLQHHGALQLTTPRPEASGDGQPLNFPAGTHHTLRTLLQAVSDSLQGMSGEEYDTIKGISPTLAAAMNAWWTAECRVLDGQTTTISTRDAQKSSHDSVLKRGLEIALAECGVPSEKDGAPLTVLWRVGWMAGRLDEFHAALTEAGCPTMDDTTDADVPLSPAARVAWLASQVDDALAATAGLATEREELQITNEKLLQSFNKAEKRRKSTAGLLASLQKKFDTKSETVVQLGQRIAAASKALTAANILKSRLDLDTDTDIPLSLAERIGVLANSGASLDELLINQLDAVLDETGVPRVMDAQREGEVVPYNRTTRLRMLSEHIEALKTTTEEQLQDMLECHGQLNVPLGALPEGQPLPPLYTRLQDYIEANLQYIPLMTAAAHVVARWQSHVDQDALTTPWADMRLSDRLRATAAAMGGAVPPEETSALLAALAAHGVPLSEPGTGTPLSLVERLENLVASIHARHNVSSSDHWWVLLGTAVLRDILQQPGADRLIIDSGRRGVRLSVHEQMHYAGSEAQLRTLLDELFDGAVDIGALDADVAAESVQ